MATSSVGHSDFRRKNDRSPLICLDAGHGGSDPGAVFGSLHEKDIVLAVVLKTKPLLEANGLRVILTRNTDTTVSLNERCWRSNVQVAKVFLSVHCNADADPDTPGFPEATGSEVWHHPNSERGKALAELLGKGLKDKFQLRFRGLKASKDLYVLKHTKAPAALVELGFIDSRQDSTLLEQEEVQDSLARILSSALQKFLE